ncbi:MAG TPA: hypothetical protein VJY62_03315 [Bacteroidia bacterium]|nr:hypothetical protein [Bacteroidia bacterium]
MVNGGSVYSWKRTATVAIIGLFFTIVPICSIYMVVNPEKPEMVKKRIGLTGNEIVFDKNNISLEEVDKIGESLIKATFFLYDSKVQVIVKKTDNDYEIFVSCLNEESINDDVLNIFNELQSEMQKLFPDNKIVFNLYIDKMENIVERIE